MTRQAIFWVLMLLWLLAILGVGLGWPYSVHAGSVMLFILLALLGWQVFGPAIKG